MDENVRGAISEFVTMQIVDDEGADAGFEASFGFDPSDPCAMTVTFHPAAGLVVWTFARDLLIEGAVTPTGEGAVHVFPCLDEQARAVVMFDLESEDGQVLVQCGAREVEAFTRRMITLVPRSAESALIDEALSTYLAAQVTT